MLLDGCGLASVGWVRSKAELDNGWGVEETKPTLTWNIGFRGGLSFPFGTSWALFTRLDVLFTLDPPQVEILGREIWTYPHASSVVQVGLVYAFDVTHPTAKPPPAPLF
ncbi:MAG TPA: hypothetical protein VM694_32320 [Polyangium sp.]|nr:hypothetical protein [Polyangium sp.]